eukprot:s22_g2.t1
MLMIGEGIEHLEFAMQLYRWQVSRGKLAIFEHPATSKGWKEDCVERAAAMKGVQRVRGHQSAYGLQVKDGFNKKPTEFLVNGESLAKRLGEEDMEDALDREVERAGEPVRALRPPRHPNGAEDEEEEEDAPEGGLSREDKRLIQKLGNNVMGHPAKPEFCRALRLTRARPEVRKYVKKEFQCSIISEPRPQPKAQGSKTWGVAKDV